MNLLDRIRMHAVVRPGGIALEWPGGQLDYASLAAQVESTMHLLWDSGARVVAVDLDNGPAWVALDIAAMQLGICLVPLPPFFSTAQWQHLVERSGVQLVVSDRRGEARRRLAGLLADVDMPAEIAGRALTLIETRQPADTSLPDGVHKITFTSGTTGEPKGVMLSWAQIQPVVTSLAVAAGMRSDDRHLCLMPLSVLLENIAGVYVPLWAGATSVLLPAAETGLAGSAGLDAMAMVGALGASRATTAILTPQLLQGLVETLEAVPGISLGLRFVALGGAPVSPRLLQRAADLDLPVYEGYGLSECASVVCLNGPAAHRPGSVGRPLPHQRLRIADDGQVMIGRPGFVGYLGEAPVTAGEWPTGDLGELDADGYLYLHGRRRNVFITAYGRNVAPEWVERELALEPAIAQAAVFGEARPCNVAVVVPAVWAKPADIETAIAHVNKSLPDYARIARWVSAEQAFSPANGMLTGTGRVRRAALYQRYAGPIESLYCEAQTS